MILLSVSTQLPPTLVNCTKSVDFANVAALATLTFPVVDNVKFTDAVSFP